LSLLIASFLLDGRGLKIVLTFKRPQNRAENLKLLNYLVNYDKTAEQINFVLECELPHSFS